MDVKDVHRLNTNLSMEVMVGGSVTEVKEEQRQKAWEPRLVIVGGRVIVWREDQPIKALTSIDVTVGWTSIVVTSSRQLSVSPL